MIWFSLFCGVNCPFTCKSFVKIGCSMHNLQEIICVCANKKKYIYIYFEVLNQGCLNCLAVK